MTDSVLLQTDSGGVAILTFNRPEKHSAFDNVIIAELAQKPEQMQGGRPLPTIPCGFSALTSVPSGV